MDKSEREAFVMLKSMTGFGRCENITDEYRISVEMKAVNHRYLDLSIKMPKKFNYFEASIRTLLKKYIQRGRLTCSSTTRTIRRATCALSITVRWQLNIWIISIRWRKNSAYRMM